MVVRKELMTKGRVLFAAPDRDEFVEMAKKYCKNNELTHDQVKIVKKDKQVLVIVK